MSIFIPKKSCPIWVYNEKINLKKINIVHIKQKQRDCVPCVLSMITKKEEKNFYDIDNSNPVEWSTVLKEYGFKLAICIYNFCLLENYVDQLQKGTFLVGIYNGEIEEIVNNTANKHLILIHEGIVFDSNVNKTVKLTDSIYIYNYINRMYRLVPSDYPDEI